MKNINKANERAKMIACMEYIARQINDENVLEIWLMSGVADGDIEYGNLDITNIDDYYFDDNTFKGIMSTFLVCMYNAFENGGLYCSGITCKDKNDYISKEAEV